MADLPSTKNPVTIFKGMRDKLSTRTGLTVFGPDSASRAILDGSISEQVELRNDAREALMANQIGTARGKDLDAIGGERRPRLKAVAAYVTTSEESLSFFTDTTFDAINGGAGFTIPAGTIVRVQPDPRGESIVSYILDKACNCPAGRNVAYASAKAVSIGSAYNVRANSLTLHNFTGYTDSANNSLYVTNLYPILNGRDLESDDNYRYRLGNHYASIAGANSIKLQLDALEVPGVSLIKTIPGYYGVGTVAVVVFGAEGESNASLVSSVQRRLSSVQTGGLKAVAIPGIRVEFDFEVNVIVSEPPSTEQQRALTSGIRRSIQSYLREADSKSFVDFEGLRRIIISENGGMVGLSSASSRRLENIFDGIYVRRSFTSALVSSERETISSSTYSLENDEFASAGTVNVSFEVRS